MAPLEAAKTNQTLADLSNLRQAGDTASRRAGNRGNPTELCSAILGQDVAEFMEVLPAGGF
jgi:hypothetical protein